jgi:hypothetical protein
MWGERPGQRWRNMISFDVPSIGLGWLGADPKQRGEGGVDIILTWPYHAQP